VNNIKIVILEVIAFSIVSCVINLKIITKLTVLNAITSSITVTFVLFH